jgi:hypothetical protein
MVSWCDWLWRYQAGEIGKDSFRLAVVNVRLVFSPAAFFLKRADAYKLYLFQ